MIGERSSIRGGYRWDVFADFLCNSSSVRVGVRKTQRGARRLAERFAEANLKFGCGHTHVKLRHDPLLDATLSRRRR